jgi:predicted DNA-binding protein
MTTKMIRVQFDLPGDLRKRLERHAKSTGQSLSATMREAIMLDLAKTGKSTKTKRHGAKVVTDAKKR